MEFFKIWVRCAVFIPACFWLLVETKLNSKAFLHTMSNFMFFHIVTEVYFTYTILPSKVFSWTNTRLGSKPTMDTRAYCFPHSTVRNIFVFFKYNISQLKWVILEIGMDQINTRILLDEPNLQNHVLIECQISKNHWMGYSGLGG